MEVLNKYNELEENIKLVYQEPEVFSKYHVVYYGQKYGQYYFRKSPDMLLEKAKYIDSGYFIMKNDKIIGGVFLKPNFMTDLFVVPPYNDYEYVLEKLLEYLKKTSDKNEKIIIREVVEELLPLYKSKGCILDEDGFWMIRPTELMYPTLPDEYEAKDVIEEYKNEIADVIIAAYSDNPAFKSVHSKQCYIEHVEEFIKNYKDNDVLNNSTKVVIYKPTNEIVGSCLHMEFEGLPLIMSFAVRPDHQGKGVGSYLIKHSISCTSIAYPATRLYVYNHNDAMKVYEHVGFINNRTLNDMYLINE